MTNIDERPAVWIGHMFLATTDIEKTASFMGRNNFLSGLKVRDEGARTC